MTLEEWLDFARHQSLGQVPPEALLEMAEGLHQFELLFGETWVRAYFPSNGQVPLLLWSVLSAWRDWKLIRDLRGSEHLADRWRKGPEHGGVRPELRFLAGLVRAGVMPSLEPTNGHGGRCDASFEIPGHPLVFVEVSRRGLSAANAQAHEMLRLAVAAGMRRDSEREVSVGFLREANQAELEDFLRLLAQPATTPLAIVEPLGIIVDRNPAVSGTFPPEIETMVPHPRLLMVEMKQDHSSRRVVRAMIPVNDEKMFNLLSDEASQLPKSEFGILVIDVSSYVGGPPAAAKVAEKWLSRKVYSRVKGILLVGASLTSKGVETRGAFLPAPGENIDDRLRSLLERVLAGVAPAD